MTPAAIASRALLATTLLSLFVPTALAVPLGAEDAIARALAENPALRAALYDALAARLARDAARNARIPLLVGGIDGAQTESFAATGSGLVRNRNRQAFARLGVRYTTDVGTTLELNVSSGVQARRVNRDAASAQVVDIDPFYSLQTQLVARQPLLRGAGRDANLAEIRVAEQSARLARESQSLATSEVIRDLLVAYWELWYADRALAVQREALLLTERQEAEARARFEVLGTVARVDALAFATEASALRESLATAESDRRTRAVTLGAYVAMPPADAFGIVPDGTPSTSVSLPTLEALIEIAMTQSPEMASLEAELETRRIQIAAARNEKKARLDAVATAGLSGLYTDDALPGLQLPGRRPATFVTGGLELELPVGPSRQKSEYDRQVAGLSAAEARFAARRLALEGEIASLYERARAALERVSLAMATAVVARELAEAERARLSLGTTTGFDVLRAQQRERETELRELRARVDAVAEVLRLEHAVGRLLERFSLTTPEDPS
jgi:outer membrane protein